MSDVDRRIRRGHARLNLSREQEEKVCAFVLCIDCSQPLYFLDANSERKRARGGGERGAGEREKRGCLHLWKKVVKVMTVFTPFSQWEFSVAGGTGNSLFLKDVYSPSIFLLPRPLPPRSRSVPVRSQLQRSEKIERLQGATKTLSDSPGLVKFSVSNFLRKISYTNF